MRYPGENGAGQPSGRRRGASEPDAQPGRRHGAASGQSGDSVLFSPGYRDSQQPSGAGDAEPGRYGRAGGTAGKGPLRGFPPAPGQPAPLYPPGQFSAWNQASMPGRGGDRPAGAPAGADGGFQDAGYSALAVSDPAADVTSTQTWGAVSDGRETGTWTYRAGQDGETTPGQPVSRGTGRPAMPGQAADAGSFGGQDTGTWRAGAGPAQGRARHGKPGRASGPASAASPAGQRPADIAAARAGTAAGAASRSPAGSAATGLAGQGTAAAPEHDAGRGSRPPAGKGTAQPATRQDGLAADGRGRSGPAGRGPAGPVAKRGRTARRQARREPAAPAAAAAGRATAAAPQNPPAKAVSSSRSRKPSRARKRSARGPVLVSIAIVVVLGALGYYLFSHQHASTAGPAAQASPGVVPAASPRPASPSATAKPPPPGRWRYIAARASDPLPLTLSELFPARFTAGAAYTRAAGLTGRKCAAGVVGQRLQHAVASAGCSQVLRATYLSVGKKQMGTIGVLNLRTAAAAATAGKAAGAAQFIRPLNAKRGPASKLSKAVGLEEAEVKGHYLILVFADISSGHAPKAKAQRQALVIFMNQLIRHTVNVSLTSRMVAGKP
jgi:hypothetical protein